MWRALGGVGVFVEAVLAVDAIAPRLGHRVCTGTCGPAQGPPDPVVGTALWRPGHRIMKKKLKKTGRERAVLGARRQRPAAAARARRRPATGHRAASGLRATRAVASSAMARRRCLAATVPAGAAAPSRTRGACPSGGPPGRQARAAQPADGRQRARGADGLANVFLLEQVEQDHAGHDHVAA
eukprot:scaffold24_cov162-Isochrysis_galbana.AAC.1